MLAKHIALSSLLLAFALPLASVAPAHAESSDVPSAVPSDAPSNAASQIDPNFLLLPAYDLQWVNPPQSVRVGDTLTARLSGGKLPPGLVIRLPAGTENADDLPFAWSDGVTTGADGSPEISVTPTKPGQLTLPSLALADASGKSVARTDPTSLNVVSAIASNDPKPKEPDPPRPPVSLGIPVATLILLCVLALGIVAGVVFWLVRWSRSRRGELPPKPAEPPKPEDEVALARLAQLERKGLVKAGQFKAHYFGISEIIKHYVGERYGFDAAESTTFEMISHIEQNGGLSRAAPQAAIDLLRELFDRLDRVKFTDHVPVAVEGTELLEEARKLVLTTRRPPSVVMPSAGGSAGGSDASR